MSADGPALAAWLDRVVAERGMVATDYGDSFARKLYAWRHGVNSDFFTVDRWLCQLGLHPNDAPEHVWRPTTAKDHRCWNCGGSTVRCCEYAAAA